MNTSLSPAAVRDEVARRLKERWPAATLTETDPHTVVVDLGDGRSVDACTFVVWDQLRRQVSDEDWTTSPAIERFVGGLAAMHNTPAPGRLADRLRVVVRGTESLTEMVAGHGLRMPVIQPMAGLVGLLVEDHDDTVAYVDEARVLKEGLTIDDAFAVAIDHTRVVLEAQLDRVPLFGTLVAFQGGGTFDSSVVLFPALWKSLRKAVRGDVILALPTRDKVVAAAASDAAGVDALRALVRAAWVSGGPSRVSDNLYRFTAGGWRLEEARLRPQ